MTTISLMTNDQLLIAVQKPTVAAGDQNSVILHVDFDSAWDGFTARSAVFYTSNDATVYEQLLTENECFIPAEVLAETGTLFIGVRGIPTDGSAIKTSSIVNYRIVKGATDGAETTISPAQDMYQQYLAAMDAKLAPIYAQLEEKIQEYEQKTAEVEAEYETRLNSLLQPTILYDSTAGNLEDLESMDLSAYNRFYFIYDFTQNDTDNTGYLHTNVVAMKGIESVIAVTGNNSWEVFASITDTGMTLTTASNATSALSEIRYIIAYK